MHNQVISTFCFFFVLSTLAFPVYAQKDTDGDGLLDLEDIAGPPPWPPCAPYCMRGIEDLDGANQLHDLGTLDLSQNSIRAIENGDFKGLTSLATLSLWSNRIKSLERGDFEGLSNLRWLDLGYNQISEIEPGNFEGLTNLEWLRLEGNGITSVGSGDFSELENLQELDLTFNSISRVEHGMGENLASLDTLLLSFQEGGTTIESGAFAGLTNLTVLALNDIRTLNLQHGAFEGLANLETLDLTSSVGSLENGTFEDLPKLEELFLSFGDSGPIELQSGLFNGLTSLHTLRVSGDVSRQLNLAGATFTSLAECQPTGGFCVHGQRVNRLLLDHAELNESSFQAILDQTKSITEATLYGLTFSGRPDTLAPLLSIRRLETLTIDEDLYSLFPQEFDDFSATGNKTLLVAVPDCDSDGLVGIRDANCTPDHRLDAFLTASGTVRGDLDGMGGVAFADFLKLAENFGNSPANYTDGDFDKSGSVGFLDFLRLAENFGQGADFGSGGAVAAVPEPNSVLLMIAGILLCRRRCFKSDTP